MSQESVGGRSEATPKLGWLALRRIIQVAVGISIQGVVLFVSAGRLDWIRAWVYVGIALLSLVFASLVVLRTNPEVIAERGKKHEGTRPFDKVFSAFYAAMIFVGPLVAGLDAGRFGWTSMPFQTLYAGVVLYVLGHVLITWSVATNPHAEKTVRIQEDRGHEVVTSGPYRLVRHPVYVGGILQNAVFPLILGSLWAFVPAVIMALLLVVRTAFEDQTLRKELPGYEEYSLRTRYRLLPGVW